MTADTEQQQPFISHLIELRDRLLRVVLAILAVFVVLFPFANDIYTLVAGPLMAQLPEGSTMIATQVASPFLTPFKLSLFAAVFLAMPFILYQLWGFVAPGLYTHERQLALPLLASSIALFYLGMVFAYFVVFPLVFGFLISVAPEGVSVMTDISAYLDFVIALFFAFGVAFEVPIATIILVTAGVSTPEQLGAKRPYVIVGSFVIGMLLTPPDIISQTLLALPMWVLFELGIFFSRIIMRRRGTRDDADDEAAADDEPEPPAPISPAPAAAADNGGAAFASQAPPAPPGSAEAARAEAQRSRPPADEGFVAMTDEEMDRELDRIEAEENDDTPYWTPAGASDAEAAPTAGESGAASGQPTPRERVEVKLQTIYRLRHDLAFGEARQLLYEVLVEGDEDQVRVARNILAQMDDPL